MPWWRGKGKHYVTHFQCADRGVREMRYAGSIAHGMHVVRACRRAAHILSTCILFMCLHVAGRNSV